ncbi:MAG: tRNA (adenosine(37)-N6)-dimethylallyltransferase MiaA [Actinomycetes bacterium]
MESAPAVIALYGPTATGKSTVAGILRDRLAGEVISADSAALYAGLETLTAAPSYPARLTACVPRDSEVSVGEYQRLAHTAIDDVLEGGAVPLVVGGTGLYLRAALSSFTFPPAPAEGERERWSAVYDELGAEGAHVLLESRDPAAALRVHANDRRRVIRALELSEAGSSLAPPVDRLWSDDMRHETVLVGLDLPLDLLDARIAVRVEEMVAAGVVAEARAAWAEPLSPTARKVLGLEEFATLPEREAVEAVVTATRRLARYQRKWLRRLPVVATLAADRPPEEIADAIVALAGTGERLSRR